MYNFNDIIKMENNNCNSSNNNNNNISNNNNNNNNSNNNNNNNNNSNSISNLNNFNSNNNNNINSKPTANSNFFQMKNNCTMEWSNDICLRLIDEYKNFPALWDQTSPFYKNKLKRKESWCRLAERFGCSKAEVERKMNVLLTQYRREKHKMLMQVYKGELKCSRWYAFKKFSFMENGLRPKKQQRAFQLLNAMQLRLGFNPLQSVQNSNPLQNLTSWHTANDLHHQSDNNNSMSITNDTELSCPTSVQDLSINHISGADQNHNNSIQQQSANSTIEDEMVEINVDPLNLLSGHQNLLSLKNSGKTNFNSNNNINSNKSININNGRQRPQSINYHRDVKEEIFDCSSIDNDDHHNNEQIIDQSFQHTDRENVHHDDDDDDDGYSILDYRRHRYNNNFSPKKKFNCPSNDPAYRHNYPNNLQNTGTQKDEKSDHWSDLLPPVATTEKPSTTKLFQNYENQSLSIADKDDCDFIGLNVALKLRSMEESQRIIAEKLISDVLFYGQFKELDRSANVCPKKEDIG